MDDFFVGGHGSSEYGARLLASYTVSGVVIERQRVQPTAGLRFVPAGSKLSLKEISLPVHVYGETPRDAQRKRAASTPRSSPTRWSWICRTAISTPPA